MNDEAKETLTKMHGTAPVLQVVKESESTNQNIELKISTNQSADL